MSGISAFQIIFLQKKNKKIIWKALIMLGLGAAAVSGSKYLGVKSFWSIKTVAWDYFRLLKR
jgi:hypothetical protein